MPSFPDGTKFNNWSITHDTQKGVKRLVVRRWAVLPDGTKKLERLPVSKYERFRDKPEELEKLVIRLNDRLPQDERTREAIRIKHAFIDPDLLDEYRRVLLSEIPTERDARAAYTYLTRYFLHFFIHRLKLNNPVQWKLKEHIWAESLLNRLPAKDRDALALLEPGKALSAKTLRTIVNQANRFMAFLHDRRPEQTKPLSFSPISKAMFKKLEATRKLNNQVIERQVIPEKDWKRIQREADPTVKALTMLCYRFGLRRSEALGLTPKAIRYECLHVTQQLVKCPEGGNPDFGPLKGRDARSVPYWDSSPDEAYKLVEAIQDNLMHPDTFTDRWNNLMDSLGLDYDIHDLRHTWCTRMGRRPGMLPRDLQLAAGHKDLRTTMKYMHDDRSLDTRVWKPGN